MSAAEVWSYVQLVAFVILLAWVMYLTQRLERTEVRLAQSRIDVFKLVDVLDEAAEYEFNSAMRDQLRTTFPHLYDVDEREADERAAERAS